MLHITCNNVTCYMDRELLTTELTRLIHSLAHSLTNTLPPTPCPPPTYRPASYLPTDRRMATDWYSPLWEQGTKKDSLLSCLT